MSRDKLNNISFRTVEIEHRNRAYEISYFVRRGRLETLVYLHGLGSTKYDFLRAVEQESFKDFTLFAFDFPGSGNSSYFDQVSLTMDDLVEITSKVFSSLRLGRLSLIGHSLGGLTGLLYAQKHRNKVICFVSVEGNIAPEDCGVLSRGVAQLTWRELTNGDYLKTLQDKLASQPYIGTRIFADTFRKSVSTRALYDYCLSIVQHSDSGALMPAFKQLSIPRLFIYGEANQKLSYLSELRRCGIRVIRVPNSHHWPHHDNPEYYFQRIESFLTRLQALHHDYYREVSSS